ncbi:MAG: TRAP transporter small permease subunit [Gammaproteobacteria bacterium]|nr:TRAP transporter small permease subunit [Gammaproteobacteria bacterium]MDH3559432.1 TRAP transporter small permease subunit [Gammaproteobacteria bacterium]
MYEKLHALARGLDSLAELTGRLIAWLTLGTVLITFAVVVLRYVFQTGSIALQESISYLHAAVFMLGAAYTLKHDGHVRVDIFYRALTPRGKAWINLLGTLLLLTPVCAFILYSSWEYVAVSWSMREASQEAGGLDAVFLLKTAIPLMAALLLLQGLSMVLHSILLLAGWRPDTDSGTAGLDREL